MCSNIEKSHDVIHDVPDGLKIMCIGNFPMNIYTDILWKILSDPLMLTAIDSSKCRKDKAFQERNPLNVTLFLQFSLGKSTRKVLCFPDASFPSPTIYIMFRVFSLSHPLHNLAATTSLSTAISG